jgi:hypothetical protein
MVVQRFQVLHQVQVELEDQVEEVVLLILQEEREILHQ